MAKQFDDPVLQPKISDSPHSATLDTPCIKIVFIGDCGVGKSTLVGQLIGSFDDSRSSTTAYSPTTGNQIQILSIYDYEARQEFFVELHDIGGSKAYLIVLMNMLSLN